MRKKTTVVGIVTLIVGLALGLGIGIWSVKSSQASNASGTPLSLATPAPSGSAEPSFNKNEWDPFRQMERMQEEVDRAIRDATEKFSLGPGATVFRPDTGYSSSFDLRDRKDHYELRAYLPDVNPADVNVKIDNDQTLRVSVKQQKQQTKNTNSGSASITQLGEYEQVVTLPEAVRSQDMKIDRHGHEIVITIPKAKAG